MWQRRAVRKPQTTSSGLSIAPSTHLTYPILGSLQYFSGHWDFLRSATEHGPVSYHLANQKGIAIPLEKRQHFFSDSRASFILPSAFMLGITPTMNKDFLVSIGIDIFLHDRFNKLLSALMRNQRINGNLPSLYQYAEECISGLDTTTNPFDTIYDMIVRLSVNTFASSGIAASVASSSTVAQISRGLDRPGTPIAILFPWFLGWGRIRRFYLLRQLYRRMTSAICERRREGRNDKDPLQYMLDAGLSSLEISQFTFSALFAATATPGIVAAYTLCDLATHPTYLAQVRQELEKFVAQFEPDDSLPISARLQSITYEDWIKPANLPIINRCLRETLRLRIATPLHRLNDSGADIDLGGTLVPAGTILTFHSSFLHHNEDMYTAPLTWDPERFTDARAEDKAQPMSFVGWGLGKHQCIGQKFAKFEIFLLTTLMLFSYDMEAVDKDGCPLSEMPPVALNNTLISPPSSEVHLKLTSRG
ncbi:cytochrome P450 [Mycena vitilis]|nr:cytochrome P450 [Mycena vitilis]